MTDLQKIDTSFESFNDWYNRVWLGKRSFIAQCAIWTICVGLAWIPYWYLFSCNYEGSFRSKLATLSLPAKVGYGLLTLAVIARLGAGSDQATASRQSSLNSDALSANNLKTDSQKESKQLGVNDEFTLGDYKYCISRTVFRSSIGNKFINEKASSGATFLIVYYRIENLTKESQNVLSDDFKLIDFEGRQFSSSNKATTALLSESDDKDFILSQLQPGISREMVTAFEIPMVSTEQDLTIVIPKKGFFSSGDARVVISK